MRWILPALLLLLPVAAQAQTPLTGTTGPATSAPPITAPMTHRARHHRRHRHRHHHHRAARAYGVGTPHPADAAQ